jgi:hypothetical protein
LLGKVAGAVRGVENLVVEDGEIEGEAEADGMSRSQFSLGNVGSILKFVSKCGTSLGGEPSTL